MARKDIPVRVNPSILETTAPTSFGGITFAAERIVLHSQGRQHVHEFPHMPAGAPEKLGRGVWYLTVTGNFQNRFAKFPGLYPDAMNQLRQLYEKQETNAFVHPTVGQFQAFISGWRQDYNPGKSLSGEKVEIEFLEDQRTAFLIATKPSMTSVASSQSQLDAAVALLKTALGIFPTPQLLGVFDAIRATSNAVQSLVDTAGLYSGLLETKALELASLCERADQLLPIQSPLALSIIDPLHDIWSQALTAGKQIQNAKAALGEWTTPRTMTIGDVALAIYGDTSRQSDLLSLNVIADPTSIPANTEITYFPTQAS